MIHQGVRQTVMAAGLCVAIACAAIRTMGAWRTIPTASAENRAEASDTDRAVRQLLEDQVAAWNRGDVEAFMAGYWKSEQTSFSGTNGVTRGWEGLLNRYKRNYPDRKAMGKLTFGQIEVTPLCADAAMILGEWHLQRENPVGGVFTLVARRFPEGWRIIHDHTDAVAPQKP